MKFAPVAIRAAALIGLLALSGCSSNSSSVTISYGDGEQVKASFKKVECDEVKASSTTIDPTHASINVHFDANNDIFRGTAWIYSDELVLFEADHLNIEHDANRVIINGEGKVQIAQQAEGNPAPGEGIDTDNAVETTGTIEATLTCSS